MLAPDQEGLQDGDTEGMQHFDGEIEKLVREAEKQPAS